MRPFLRQFLHWTPRVLGVFFAVFVSLFALDVFGQGYGFWGTLLALFMHLIPVYLLVAALAIAWRWPLAGMMLFALLSTVYLATMWGPYPLQANLIGASPIAGPGLLIALLFLLDWLMQRRQLTPR